MALLRMSRQMPPLLIAAMLGTVAMVSIMAGLQLTRLRNLQHKEDKHREYAVEVKEVNSLLENLEARFEITNLELQLLRNKSRELAASKSKQPDDARR